MKNTFLAVGAVALILACGWWFLARDTNVTSTQDLAQIESASSTGSDSDTKPADTTGAVMGDENLAIFMCKEGKTITAVFERDIVGLTLSDGRQLTLRQSTSGSGIRYLSNDNSVEFRGKGAEAELLEKGKLSYSGCMVGAQ